MNRRHCPDIGPEGLRKQEDHLHVQGPQGLMQTSSVNLPQLYTGLLPQTRAGCTFPAPVPVISDTGKVSGKRFPKGLPTERSYTGPRPPKAGSKVFAFLRDDDSPCRSVSLKSNDLRTHFSHCYYGRIAPTGAGPPAEQLILACHFQLLKTQSLNHLKPMQAWAWLTS